MTWFDGFFGVCVDSTAPALRMSTATVSPGSPGDVVDGHLEGHLTGRPGAMSPSAQVILWSAPGWVTVQVPAPTQVADPATYVVLPEVGRAGS